MNIIFSKVPTQYQYQSIHRLMGMAPTKEGSAFVVRIPIEGIEQAREWMTKRNEYLYANDYLNEREYEENKESIAYDSPTMGYDAATCGFYEEGEV
jgi:hypothetical protein